MKAETFKLPKAPQDPPLLRIEPFRGLNLSVTPTQIDQSQSPDMLNMHIDERGVLNKRTGYERVFPTSLGAGPINGLYEYQKTDGTVIFLLAHGTKLYTQSGNEQPVEIYNGLENNRVNFFTMNDKCYIMDGANYLEYDGTEVKSVDPYIPTIAISKEPTGGGVSYEDFNLLGAGFKDSFSADGTAKDFVLSLTKLDATAVIAKVDGVDKSEGTDFTVDRVLGKVTFTSAPLKGTNNVIITAYKSQEGLPERIKKCRFHVIFGGSNDTRVFVSGNANMPEYVWASDLYNPAYFPENRFYKFPDKVMGFAKQYDYLVVERLNGKHIINFQLDNGVSSFPSKPINDQVGTIATNSIQIIENNPVHLSKNGVYMLASSSIRDERNVIHLSEAVNERLLRENNLENAISIDFDKKYWLALNGNVYLYDYSIKEWFLYDNIQAHCFIERNGDLYFGNSTEGFLYRVMKETEPRPYNDDEQPIKAYWKSKHFTFGADELRKLVDKVYFGLKPMTRTSADLYYISNKKESDLVKTSSMDLLDFRNIDFNRWSFILSSFPQENMAKIKAKKITHFQLVIKNDKADDGMGLLSVGIKFRYQSAVK